MNLDDPESEGDIFAKRWHPNVVRMHFIAAKDATLDAIVRDETRKPVERHVAAAILHERQAGRVAGYPGEDGQAQAEREKYEASWPYGLSPATGQRGASEVASKIEVAAREVMEMGGDLKVIVGLHWETREPWRFHWDGEKVTPFSKMEMDAREEMVGVPEFNEESVAARETFDQLAKDLTDKYAEVLERAIRDEGYMIGMDSETGEIKLTLLPKLTLGPADFKRAEFSYSFGDFYEKADKG